jgi:hypothetical protein
VLRLFQKLESLSQGHVALDGESGKGRRGDALPEELQRRSSFLEPDRKAKVEPMAEAATASGDDNTGPRAVRQPRGTRLRTEDVQRLAIANPDVAGLNSVSTAATDCLAMPQRTRLSEAAGHPRRSIPCARDGRGAGVGAPQRADVAESPAWAGLQRSGRNTAAGNSPRPLLGPGLGQPRLGPDEDRSRPGTFKRKMH